MNKYKEGDVVYAIAEPKQKLIIRRYTEAIYYCKLAEDPEHRDLVYFERELTSQATV